MGTDSGRGVREALLRELGWEPVREVPAPLEEAVGTAERAALSHHRDAARRLATLDRWVEAWREVLGSPAFAAAPLAFRLDALNRAAIAARYRYERLGDPADFEAARDHWRHALADSPPGWAHRSRYLHNLGSVYAGRYRKEGLAKDGAEAVALLSEAVEAPEAEARLQGLYHRTLSLALQSHYDRTGDLSWLERAIAHGERALEHGGHSQALHGILRDQLGTAYRRRYLRTRQPMDLHRAVSLTEESLVDASPPSRPFRLTHLANALLERFHLADDPADLERAVGAAEEAVALTAAGDPSRPIRTNNLANALGTLHARTGRPELLDRVVELRREVVEATAAGDPWLPSRLYNLGVALHTRFGSAGRDGDADAAVDAFRRACGSGLRSSLEWGLAAAARWGALEADRGRWRSASEAYARGLDLVTRLYEAQVLPETRATWLTEARDLTLRAAWVEARRGAGRRAFQILEAGRARALHDALALRSALAGEADRAARAALAGSARRVRDLEEALRSDASAGAAAFLQTTEELERARADLKRRLQGASGRASPHAGGPEDGAVEGLAGLLRRAGGPLVHLVTVPGGASFALVARPLGGDSVEVDTVPLPDFGSRELDRVLHGEGDGAGYLRGVTVAAPEELAAVLDRVWPTLRSTLVAPLERRLLEGGARRAVLVPTGTLALLPLQALAEEVVISLAPSARTLQAIHGDRDHLARPPAFLGVGDPAGDAPAGLGFAHAEVHGAAAAFRRRGIPAELLVGREATRAAVAEGVDGGATVLHLACHGRFDPSRPMASRLDLAGSDVLRLEDFLTGSLDVSAARLVVLSACQTGLIDFLRAPDEVVGFPAGLVQAGVPGVVGTLWPVDDVSTSVLVDAFYRHLLEGDLDPASALHRARRELREGTVETLGLVERYRRHLARRPRDVAARRELARLEDDPSQRPFRHPWYWGAFTFTGR
jgi:CHAT domain-containing protein